MLQAINLRQSSEILILCVKSRRDVKERTETFRGLLGESVKVISDIGVLTTVQVQKGIPVIAIVTATDLCQFLFSFSRLEFIRICVEDLFNQTIDMDILHRVLKRFEGKWRQLVVLANEGRIAYDRLNVTFHYIEISRSPVFAVEEINISGRGANDSFLADQTKEAMSSMIRKTGDEGPGHIICFVSGCAFASSVFDKFQLTAYPKSQVLRTELRISESPDSLFERVRSEIESFGNAERFFILPVLDSIGLRSNSYILPEDLRGKVIYVICTTSESSPWINVGEIACVIDSGLCQLPVYNKETETVMFGHCIAPPSVQQQRRSHLGKTRTGLMIKVSAVPGKKLSVFAEIQRCDPGRGMLILASLHSTFKEMSLLNSPQQSVISSTHSLLVDIGAISSKGALTPLGREILNYPTSLGPIYIATMIQYSSKCQDAAHQQLYLGIVFLITECGLQMIQPGKTSADTMGCFCPESDVVTLINILRPLLADRNHDLELLESFSIHPSILDNLRSDVDELIYFLGLTHESLSRFCEVDPMKLVDSIVGFMISHFPEWCSVRTFHFVNTLPQTDFGKFCPSLFQNSNPNYPEQGILDFRPGRPNSSVPNVCLSFTSFYPLNEEKCIILMIHRDPRIRGSSLAIAGEELKAPDVSPWLLRLIELDINVGNQMFFTTNDVNTHVNYRTTLTNAMTLISNSIERMTQLLPFVPRSVLYWNQSDPAVVEILSHGTTYESRLHLHNGLVQICPLNHIKLNWLLNHIKGLRAPQPKIRIAWQFGSTQPLNLGLVCECSLPGLIPLKNFFRRNETASGRNVARLNADFQIPAKICHPSMLFFAPVRAIIEKWASNTLGRRIRVIHGGRLEVALWDRMTLNASLDSLSIPYTAVPIPQIDSPEMRTAIAAFAANHDCEMKIDRLHRVIIVPSEFAAEAKMISSGNVTKPNVENCALGCIMLCNDPERPTLTEYPVTIFHEDGHRVTERLCRSCQEESLVSAVGHFMDGAKGRGLLLSLREKVPMIPLVDCDENEQGESWPHVPIGSLLLTLLREGEHMAALVNTWMLAVYYQTFRTAPDVIQTCPNHPDHLFVVDKNQTRPVHCRVLNCYLALCPKCHEWHQADNTCASTPAKTCPKCRTETQKAGGCNHITCLCGCHWCWACMAGFNTAGLCYSHMFKEHGGYGMDDL
jgi:hypothetical protein